MTVAQLIAYLRKCEEDATVQVRDLSVSDERMENGAPGYMPLEEVLLVEGEPYLLIGSE